MVDLKPTILARGQGYNLAWNDHLIPPLYNIVIVLAMQGINNLIWGQISYIVLINKKSCGQKNTCLREVEYVLKFSTSSKFQSIFTPDKSSIFSKHGFIMPNRSNIYIHKEVVNGQHESSSPIPCKLEHEVKTVTKRWHNPSSPSQTRYKHQKADNGLWEIMIMYCIVNLQ